MLSTGTWFASLVEAPDEQGSSSTAISAAPITAVIAQQVRRLRQEADMPGAKLAGKLAALGVPWNRTTVAKFETGHRRSVTVQELLALAIALNVPPIWLLADPTTGASVPVASGVDPDPWSALLWMAGKSDTAGDWRHSQEPLSVVYQVVEIVAVYRKRRSDRLTTAALIDDPGHDDPALNLDERARLTALQDRLQYLVANGYRTPALPGDVLDRARALGVTLPDGKA